ncbi:hypothetical protein DFH28DRAFT_945889 [Melampsora americana]|nr:hypothetical protein DFH28DRAFT_945889 [Melampsora americana]
MRIVGKKILKKLLDQGSSQEFVEGYRNYMMRQKAEWPHSWREKFDSLKHRMKRGVLPCFLGMIQLLQPSNSKQGAIDPAIIQGSEFSKKLLEVWGENDLMMKSRLLS